MSASGKRVALAWVVLFLVAGCTQVEPTVTPLPPTATQIAVAPSDTPPPATATPFPPTNTPLPFTETTTPPPTETASPTETVTPIPTAPEPAAGSVAFADSGQELGEGHSTDVALGDLDGDGDLDAMVGNEGQAQAWLNDGQGGFFPNGQDLTISSGWKMGLDLGDLDGDGDLDAFIVVAVGPGRVLLNQGGAQGGTAGSFVDSDQQLMASSGVGFDLDLGDVDSDGDLDAYVAHERANLVWLNDGQGGFQDSGQRLGEAITADVALADLDGDSDLDALAGGWDEPARVWLNDGQGTFADSGHVLTAATVHIHGLDVGDLDGDGDLDVFLALASGHPNQVWFNDGQGVFSDSGQQLSSALGHAVVLGDLDGDGDLDAFMANAASSAGAPNTVWLNDGQGSFSDSGLRLGNGLSYGVDLGDLDGDGELDAFVANNSPPNVVWLNGLYQVAPPSQAIISADTADQVVQLHTLSGHSDKVFTLVFSGDGSYIASVSPDKTIKLWDVASGQELHTFSISEVGMNDIAFSPDGRLLASSETIWDVESKQVVHALDRGRYGPVAFSPDGSTLAVALFGQPIKLFDVASGQVMRTLDDQAGNLALSIEFSPDGTFLAVGGHLNGMVTLWDVENGHIVHTFAHDTRSNFHGLAFSPDGHLLASAATERTAKLWDVASGQVVHTMQGTGCYDVTFSPDGSLVATAGCGRAVMLWDVASGRRVRSLPHADEVMTVVFSPDGTLLASGGYDNQVSLWGVPR
jgi:WD40 repeat protein